MRLLTILLTDLVPEELHVSSQMFPQMSVEGVPVRTEHLAVLTGVHFAGVDRSEGLEILNKEIIKCPLSDQLGSLFDLIK